MKISLIDLKAQNAVIGDELIKATTEVLLSTQYILGNEVKTFEKEFADYLGTNEAVSVANGTDALIIALKALGIGEGDEVITTPFTFFATAESISFVGATPVFVDVDKETFNIDPEALEAKITSKTKAIMPVHLFGQACDMDAIMTIAKAHQLYVIEDACQAVGGKYNGRMLGSIGDVACFSFFPTKNLGAAGDGGMIVTNNETIATACRALRAHGSGENGQKAYNYLNGIDMAVEAETTADNTVYNPLKYYNYLIGHNSRLDEIQAAILRVKLRYLDQWNLKRREKSAFYTQALLKTKLVCPVVKSFAEPVFHMYVLQSENREALVKYLTEEGIATGIYYPVPLHLQKAYGPLSYQLGDMPNAEYLSERTFALPLYAEITEEQQQYVIDKILAWEATHG